MSDAIKQGGGMKAVEEMAADRYSVVRTAFWWRVKIGDGQQTVGRCHTEAEAERLASALRTAFLDGAFVAGQEAADELERLREAGWVCKDGFPALLGNKPLKPGAKLYARPEDFDPNFLP